MLYQAGDKIIFAAHYSDSDGVSVTGLTVTVDIYRVATDGTSTQVVSSGNASEVGVGLYSYVYTTPSSGNYQFFAVFQTADTSVQARHLAATAESGAPWVEAAGGLPDNVWSATPRTLTQTAAQVADALDGSDITILRGDTLSFTLTGLGRLAGRTRLYWTVKHSKDDADSEAIIQIEESGGLLYLNGAAASNSAWGTLTVDDESAGDITVTLAADATKLLTATLKHSYDVQMITASGVTTLTEATVTVIADVTQSIT